MPTLQIKNIIFDLGGVILDLSVDDTLIAFSRLSGLPQEKVREMFLSAQGFEAYEKGLMDDDAFRDFVRELYGVNVDADDIDRCWNAMLVGFPVEKLQLLNRLKSRYRVFLLSNTNGIHLNYINGVLLPEATGQNNLDSYFHAAYYSHRMMKRKPEPEIFVEVLEDNKLDAAETLFLDDNAANVEAAIGVGIQGQLVDSRNFILDYFDGKGN